VPAAVGQVGAAPARAGHGRRDARQGQLRRAADPAEAQRDDLRRPPLRDLAVTGPVGIVERGLDRRTLRAVYADLQLVRLAAEAGVGVGLYRGGLGNRQLLGRAEVQVAELGGDAGVVELIAEVGDGLR